MGRIALHNAILLDPESAEPTPGGLLVENGRITARLPPGEPGPDDAASIDLAGAYLAPGFVDLHFHGALPFIDATNDAPDDAGHDAGPAVSAVAAALAASSASLSRHGTTTFLATTIARPAPQLAQRVTQLAALLGTSSWSGAIPIGIHLEGPWINPAAAGAQPSRGIRAYRGAEGAELLARGEGLIRMVTLAPEVEGAHELLGMLSGAGIPIALGHSLATAKQTESAIERGAQHATHLFNAMGTIHHREPGLAGCVLADDRLTCDLICDGVHVDPRWVRIASRVKRDRLVLITDRIDLSGSADARASFGSGAVRDDGVALRLSGGRLAGSRLDLDVALRNAQSFAGMSLLDAVAACTLRPARVLGIERERGSLRPGARADLVVLDAGAAVRETWIGGRRVSG